MTMSQSSLALEVSLVFPQVGFDPGVQICVQAPQVDRRRERRCLWLAMNTQTNHEAMTMLLVAVAIAWSRHCMQKIQRSTRHQGPPTPNADICISFLDRAVPAFPKAALEPIHKLGNCSSCLQRRIGHAPLLS